VREQRSAGVVFPLVTDATSLDSDSLNKLYYQWASFVDFLIGTYGRDRFDKVYVTGHADPGTSSYAAVYGKPLAALEKEWQAWLNQPVTRP
jgi:hypothetical protein